MFTSHKLAKILRAVDISRGCFTGPSFSILNVAGVGDPVTNDIQFKLARKYVADCPIELVAYLDRAGSLPAPYWRGPLSKLFGTNGRLGPFSKIWVFNLKTETVEFATP